MNEYVSVQGDRIEEIRDAAERFGDVEDYISIDIKKMIVDIKALLAEIDRLRQLVAEDEARLNHAERMIDRLQEQIADLTAELEKKI